MSARAATCPAFLKRVEVPPRYGAYTQRPVGEREPPFCRRSHPDSPTALAAQKRPISAVPTCAHARSLNYGTNVAVQEAA
jgi:hypothetical protein